MTKAKAKIQKAVIELLKKKDFDQLKVSQICRLAGINRSTFYDNFEDIYDMRRQLQNYVAERYKYRLKENKVATFQNFLQDIAQNQEVYRLFFRLNLDSDILEQHSFDEWFSYPKSSNKYDHVFIQAGIRSVLKMWLSSGCKDSTETINDILIKKIQSLGLILD